MEVIKVRKHYDFSKAIKNPYLKKLKKLISIRLDYETIEYFKSLSTETGIPYQNLINSFLHNCADKKLKPEMVWNK
jgi:predicted DNA binding CopG/RHH family protein